MSVPSRAGFVGRSSSRRMMGGILVHGNTLLMLLARTGTFDGIVSIIDLVNVLSG